MASDLYDYDIATENKMRKAEANSRRKAQDEALVLHVREHDLFALCGGTMLLFRMVLDVACERGLIDATILAEAKKRALQHAAAFPVTVPVKKIETLRLEAWREPEPGLAALLERDGFVCVSGAEYSPAVYYGSGCLQEFKARVVAPDAVAPCPAAGAGARGRRLAPGGRPGPLLAPTGAVSGPPAPPVLVRPANPVASRSTIRIDKRLGTPEMATRLVAIVAARQPLDASAVAAILLEESGRVRFKETTVNGIAKDLGALVERGQLRLAADGYRLPSKQDTVVPVPETGQPPGVSDPDGESGDGSAKTIDGPMTTPGGSTSLTDPGIGIGALRPDEDQT